MLKIISSYRNLVVHIRIVLSIKNHEQMKSLKSMYFRALCDPSVVSHLVLRLHPWSLSLALRVRLPTSQVHLATVATIWLVVQKILLVRLNSAVKTQEGFVSMASQLGPARVEIEFSIISVGASPAGPVLARPLFRRFIIQIARTYYSQTTSKSFLCLCLLSTWNER